MILLLTLIVFVSLSSAAPLGSNASTVVPLTQTSWQQYGVDAWLRNYMGRSNVQTSNFLTDFPKAAGHPLRCDLKNPCSPVHVVKTDAPTEDIQVTLVLSGLTHFIDLFTMIHELWSQDILLESEIDGQEGYSFNEVLLNSFGDLYAWFSVDELTSQISKNIIDVMLNPALFVPGLSANIPIWQTMQNVRSAVRTPAWAWKDYAETPDEQDLNNLSKLVDDIFIAWEQQYRDIVAGRNNLTVLSFLEGGSILGLEYASQMAHGGPLSWHAQAYQMYTREMISLTLEANNVILHRANYDNMMPEDASMDLNFSHIDPYTHTIYAPVHLGVDDEGNATRQYVPKRSFESVGIESRVIYGESWQCFQATNNDDFTGTFYPPAWTLQDYPKSLYISDWDGSPDDFDAHMPLCTFNLLVNDEPNDVKQSWFIKQLAAQCPESIGFSMTDLARVDYELYRAVMLASDAWVYNLAANRTSDPAKALKDACDAAASQGQGFLDDAGKEIWSSFKTNLVFGSIFHVADVWKSVKAGANVAGSAVNGGWKAIFKEKPPVIKDPPKASSQDFGRQSLHQMPDEGGNPNGGGSDRHDNGEVVDDGNHGADEPRQPQENRPDQVEKEGGGKGSGGFGEQNRPPAGLPDQVEKGENVADNIQGL